MLTVHNKKIVLNKRPNGNVSPDCWKVIQENMDIDLKPGEFIVKVMYISVDPAMRGWINDVESYMPAVQIDETMRALGLAEVIESKNDSFAKNDILSGMFGVQKFCKLNSVLAIEKLDITKLSNLDKSMHLSILGMPGMTAYFGLTDVAKIQSGETVLISGAAGAVGSIAGQIAKIKGCNVVGIAGGELKCRYLVEELGFDSAIDYKNVKDLNNAIASSCPNGVDVFFDNVGGAALDAALNHINPNARVTICGAISQYNASGLSIRAEIDYIPILFKSARLEGFVVLDYYSRYHEGVSQLSEWIQQGKIKSKEDIRQGIDHFGEYFKLLFDGGNFGKLILEP
ncbi:NADP-dependent oxidoreductase [Zhongshania sp.]|jgi:NADPH-dependent curcumin reductase CurA|uniref:NADP-dependent oxidoreductase n=1 Tax=Zhongshania sp. TaxID=1971902 RepID=UPI0039E2D4FB